MTTSTGSSEGYARRCILSLTVRDPRLRVATEAPQTLRMPDTWPEVPVASVLWVDGAYVTCPPDHILNARRARVCGVEGRSVPHHTHTHARATQLAVPGAGSHAEASPPVPVLLEQINGGWEMLIPASYAMAFWVALVHTGARVAALSDAAQIITDMGMPVFPRDFADTSAGRQHASVLLSWLESCICAKWTCCIL